MMISYTGTVLMAIRVNIAIGDVNGINEQTFIATFSTVPLDMEITTMTKAAINKNVSGMTDAVSYTHLCV